MVAQSANNNNNNNNNSYNMMGLQNNTFYNVMVRSQNKFGWSLYSQVHVFQTMDKVKLGLTLQETPRTGPDSQGEIFIHIFILYYIIHLSMI